MRIDTKTPAVTPVVSKSVREVGTAISKRDESGDSASVVELSRAGAAASSSSIDAPLGASPERLAHLRMQIDKGEYHPDLDVLARRLVSDDLLGDAPETPHE